ACWTGKSFTACPAYGSVRYLLLWRRFLPSGQCAIICSAPRPRYATGPVAANKVVEGFIMVSTTVDQLDDTPAVKRRDWKIIGLIGAGHSCSHFFQLVFPTLFLPLAAEFGYDFVQLGLLVSVFFVISGLGQASSGFIVDRIGPTPVLRFGLACFVVSGVLIGLSTNYAMLLAAAVIGGIGNSVFHPVDYSIINHRVSARRLGHAFSTHGLTGNLGWALTPVFMAGIIYLSNWRVAAFSAAALVAFVLFLTWLGRGLLAGKNPSAPAVEAPGAQQADLSRQSVG